MALFNDTEAEQQARERLQGLAGFDLSPLWALAPDGLAILNFERWLMATSNPRMYLEQVAQGPSAAADLLTLLGASQPIADSLVQNPELATLLLERSVGPPNRAAIVAEGQALLKAATSYSHSLDRLRFLRQKWLLPLVVSDLTGSLSQEEIWLGLSDIADAVIELARNVVWQAYSFEKGLTGECQVAVVAFGKLGGQELNYSSDVDLVFVCADDFPESLSDHARRFCEMFNRALSDRMGRGALYRVDLRLRPFGGAGSVVASMRAVEAYYKLHAEPWEIQALIRSRVVTGSLEVGDRWEKMRQATCFRPKVSEFFLDELIAMRERVEDKAEPDDLKRGEGGIRDVEFLTQIFQLIHGHSLPSVAVGPTCGVLRALSSSGILVEGVAGSLIEGYTFLRKLEHRLQLSGDQQTHTLPKSDEPRGRVARTMGFAAWAEMAAALDEVRARIRGHYRDLVLREEAVDQRAEILGHLGPVGPLVEHWFDSMPSSGAYYQSLAENEGSLERVCRVVVHAPLLIDGLRRSLPVTEEVLSGEVEEEQDHAGQLRALPPDTPLDEVAVGFSRARTAVLTRWALGPHFDLGTALSALQDELIGHCMRRLYAGFDVIALGSYGLEDLAVKSDLDVLFLVRDQRTHQEAETQSQLVLSMLLGLKRHGEFPDLDLRLRPEGGKGLLVRTYEGLKTYELEDMQMWERFALGQCRLVHGERDALDVVLHCAYALPVTPERLKDLVAMKRRIETERVAPQYTKRHIKLGYGGLSDIEWFVHLHEMRYPTATVVEAGKSMEERMRALARAQLINALELDELGQARKHLLATRNHVALLKFENDIVPENPDKLDVLADAMGFAEGNAFLEYHTRVIDTVRTIYTEGLERLKA